MRVVKTQSVTQAAVLTLQDHLVRVIDETMRPAHASVWLGPEKK
jgi:hypothetical protein